MIETLYDFMVVGTTLYKVNRSTGEAWTTDGTKWYKIED